MRGLIISLILFSIMLVIITLNYYFVNKSLGDMTNITESLLPVPCEENDAILVQLIENWSKLSFWLSLSVSHNEIEELTNRIMTLQSANEIRNIEQFHINSKLLINSIEEIGRLESFSIKNIL